MTDAYYIPAIPTPVDLPETTIHITGEHGQSKTPVKLNKIHGWHLNDVKQVFNTLCKQAIVNNDYTVFVKLDVWFESATEILKAGAKEKNGQTVTWKDGNGLHQESNAKVCQQALSRYPKMIAVYEATKEKYDIETRRKEYVSE